MGFLTKVGSFVPRATVGSQVIAGVGFQPKALIIWGSRSDDGTITAHLVWGFGISASPTSRASVAATSQDAVTTTVTDSRHVLAAITLLNLGGALLAEADLTSFDADGFTLNWTTASSTTGILHYLALGGDDLTNTFMSQWEIPTSAGNKVVTGVGFKPDCVLHVTRHSPNPPPDTSAWIDFDIGVMTKDGAQWGIWWDAEDANTDANTHRRQHIDKVLGTALAPTFVSMDTDGFTVNFAGVPSFTRPVFSLCLKGGRYKAGLMTKVTGGAPASQPVTGVGFTPKGLLLASHQGNTNGGLLDHGRMGIGAASGAGVEAASAVYDQDALTSTDANRICKSDKVFLKYDASPTALDAQADLTSFDADGFTLNWTTNDGNGTQIVYLAVGDAVQLQNHQMLL
jgi:hypothetical protein